MATRVLTRLEGVPEKTLENLLSKGFFKTKNEAIRAGILELGKEYGVLKGPSYYRKKLEKSLKGRRFTVKEVMDTLNAYEA